MAKKKKISRKKLLKEPDEFLTFSARLFQYALEHKYQLLAALGGIVAVVLIVTGIKYYSLQKSKEAFALLEKSRAKYVKLLDEKDPQTAYEEVKSDFEHILDEYGNKAGGKLARVLFADICHRAENLDQAIFLYEKALADFQDPFIRNSIYTGLAYAYEKKQAYKKATEYFEKIAASADPVLKGEALFNIGRLYAVLGDHEKSQTAYQQLVAEQPDSIYIDLAKELAGK
jgi:tetratricopeptide (TPR) repeat protein